MDKCRVFPDERVLAFFSILFSAEDLDEQVTRTGCVYMWSFSYLYRLRYVDCGIRNLKIWRFFDGIRGGMATLVVSGRRSPWFKSR